MVSITKAKSPITRISRGVFGYELIRTHAEGDCDSKKQGDQVCQNILGSIGHGSKNTAFTDQISEHKEAYQRNRLRGNKSHDHGYGDGKAILMVLETDLGL